MHAHDESCLYKVGYVLLLNGYVYQHVLQMVAVLSSKGAFYFCICNRISVVVVKEYQKLLIS